MSYIDPAHKLFAHLPRLAMLQQGQVPPPINLEIDLSNRCSLGCAWCHFAHTHTRGPLAGKAVKPDGAIPGGDLMDSGLAQSIVAQFADAGVASVTWTGGGEPTLHPDFDEIVAGVPALGLDQGLYTHGGHISRERAELLKRVMTFVYVSLDAADRDAYRRDKGVDRFDSVCEGIRGLVRASGDATVGIGYLVTADNWRAAGRAADLAAELGADYLQFRPTIAYEQARPGERHEDTAWMPEALAYLQDIVVRSNGNVELDERRFRDYQHWVGHPYRTCWWSALQAVVTPSGAVWTCVNKREHPAALLGSLAEETFAEIWARRPVAEVDGTCRVMCRGHVANEALDVIFADRPHTAFV